MTLGDCYRYDCTKLDKALTLTRRENNNSSEQQMTELSPHNWQPFASYYSDTCNLTCLSECYVNILDIWKLKCVQYCTSHRIKRKLLPFSWFCRNMTKNCSNLFHKLLPMNFIADWLLVSGLDGSTGSVVDYWADIVAYRLSGVHFLLYFL